MTALTYFTLTGTYLPDSSLGSVSGTASIAMLVNDGDVLAAPTLPGIVVPTVIPAKIIDGTLCDESGNPGVQLVANTAVLNLTGNLYYTVTFDLKYHPHGAPPESVDITPVTFEAPTSAVTIDLSTVTPAAGFVASQVSAIGLELLTAANAVAARADLGAGGYLGSVASQSAMLALTGNAGDYCYRSDLSCYYYLVSLPASTFGNWSPGSAFVGRQPNTVAVLGDSVTAGGSYGDYLPGIGHSWIQQLPIQSYQRIRCDEGNFAVAGTLYADALATQLPQVLAMNPLPGACIIASGGNDVRLLAAPNPNFSTMVATLKTIVAVLVAAGIKPILWAITPDTYASPISPTLYQANIHQWNTYIRRYAATHGYPMIDSHTAMADINGVYYAGYGDPSNAAHPSPAGQRLIAQKAIADGILDAFPPTALVHTARQINDLSNMFNDGTNNLGLFTLDSNSDGLGNGLTLVGPATCSLVAPTSQDNLHGQWQQMTVTAGNQAHYYYTFSTGWNVGDLIAFSARVQTNGIEASGTTWNCSIINNTPGGFVTPDGTNVTVLYNGLVSWQSDIVDGELYVEFPILSAMTTMQLYVWVETVPTGSATVRVGEATVRNLTQGGLLI